MNLSPASSIAAKIRLRQHARVGDHGHVRQLMSSGESFDDGQDGLGLGLVPLKRVHLKREPAHVGQLAHGDLRLQPTFLGEPGSRNPSPSSISKYNVVTS